MTKNLLDFGERLEDVWHSNFACHDESFTFEIACPLYVGIEMKRQHEEQHAIASLMGVSKGKSDSCSVRDVTVGVLVSAREYELLKAKADLMGMTPGHWLRQAGLARRLPSPSVSAISSKEYAELAQLASTIREFAWGEKLGQSSSVGDHLLAQLRTHVDQLERSLLRWKGID